MAKKARFTAAQVVQALKNTQGQVYLAAEQLGCVVQTIYNYAERFPVVRETIQFLKGRRIDGVELSLYNAALAGQPWAVCFLLKTQAKDRGYIERFEHTGRDGKAMEFADMSDDELDNEVARLQRIIGPRRPRSGPPGNGDLPR